MPSPHSRKPSSGSSGGNWRRKSTSSSENGNKRTWNTTPKKDDPPPLNQRAITSYFGVKPSNNLGIKKSASAVATSPQKVKLSAVPTLSGHGAETSNSTTPEVTQVINIDDSEDENWELDSQKTEVLEQLEPLMSQMIESTQTQYADSFSLFYEDELDELLQYYDVDAAAQVHEIMKRREKEKQTIGENEASKIENSATSSYYLSNFMAILDVVEAKDRHLFWPEELEIIKQLRNSSVSEQRLFSRLLYRKGPWFQVSKLEYHDINDMKSTIDGMLASGAFFEEPSGIADILPTLNNAQLRQLTRSPSNMKRDQLLATATKWVSTQRTVDGKKIKIPKDIGQCIRIKESVDVLFKRVHRLFFLNQVEDQTTLMLIHTGQIKFPTYLLPSNINKKGTSSDEKLANDRWIHDSVCSYELSCSWRAEEGDLEMLTPPDSATQDLRDFLFPSPSDLDAIRFNASRASNLRDLQLQGVDGALENVEILKKAGLHSVFKTREDLDDYENALQMSHKLMELLGSEIDVDNDTTDNEKRKKQTPNAKNLNDEATISAAMQIVEDAVYQYQLKRSGLESNASKESEEKLEKEVDPASDTSGANLFLNRFTATWVYTSIIWVGVSMLERQRKYKEAILYLKLLLDQYDVNRGRRGEWWIRLVFDVAHLKDIDHAIELCCNAIEDENCRPQILLKIYDKLRILLKSKVRESIKEEKENEKKRKEDERSSRKRRKGEDEEDEPEYKSPTRAKRVTSIKQDEDEQENDLNDIDAKTTPKKTARAKRSSKMNSPVKPSCEAQQTATSPSSSPTSVVSSSSSRSPTSPSSPSSSPKGRRGVLAVPIPLPGEAIDITDTKNDVIATPSKNVVSSFDRTVPGQKSENRSESPTRSPPLRYRSPVRYSSPERPHPSLPQISSPKKLQEAHTHDQKIKLEFEPSEQFLEDDDIAELTPEISDCMIKLGVPLPVKLNPGKIETIFGKRQSLGLASPSGWGNRSVFVSSDGSPMNVEEFSLQHYKLNEGWPCGTHCEGSPYFALFMLLFWDIIFDVSIPYVFQTPYQDAPLDITTEVFYFSRKKKIDERLNLIYFSLKNYNDEGENNPSKGENNHEFNENTENNEFHASINDSSSDKNVVIKILENHYFTWHGRQARGVDWARWKIGDLTDIARCLGGPVLALLCERFATDFRFTHSGLPDLLLWNPSTKRAKLVEVKGPGDSLSEKQIIWIDALARRGCDIVTLYVKKEEEVVEGAAADEMKSGSAQDEIESNDAAPKTPVANRKRAKRSSSSLSSSKSTRKKVEDDEEE